MFDKDGDRLGSNTLIVDDYVSINTNNLSADMDEDGKVIVAWQDNENDSLFIYLQQVDNMGVLVGGQYRATTVNNDMAPGGDFLTHSDKSQCEIDAGYHLPCLGQL